MRTYQQDLLYIMAALTSSHSLGFVYSQIGWRCENTTSRWFNVTFLISQLKVTLTTFQSESPFSPKKGHFLAELPGFLGDNKRVTNWITWHPFPVFRWKKRMWKNIPKLSPLRISTTTWVNLCKKNMLGGNFTRPYFTGKTHHKKNAKNLDRGIFTRNSCPD